MAPSASARASSAPSAEARGGGAADVVDLAIVGAGPVGLYAAYYAGFRGLSTKIIEALPVVGGQIAAFYPDSIIYDAPGFAAVSGRDLVLRLEEQARRFPLQLHLGEEAIGLRGTADGGLLNVGGYTDAGLDVLTYSKAVKHGALGICPSLVRAER